MKNLREQGQWKGGENDCWDMLRGWEWIDNCFRKKVRGKLPKGRSEGKHQVWRNGD